MKKNSLLILALLFTGSVFAADTNTTGYVKNAIAKLKSAANYSWTTTLKMPDMPFTPGPVKGKSQKDGFALLSQEMNDNTVEAALKGEKVALKNEGQWQLLDEVEGFGAMMGAFLTANGTATQEAEKMLAQVSELKAGEEGLISGDFSSAGAGKLMAFRPRGANSGPTPPAPKNAKGSIKFWIKDGALVKFESHLQGTVAFGPDQEEHEMDVTRTVEIKDVGTTTVEVPAAAKSKLEAPKPETK